MLKKVLKSDEKVGQKCCIYDAENENAYAENVQCHLTITLNFIQWQR